MGKTKDYIDSVIRKNFYYKKDYHELQRKYDALRKAYDKITGEDARCKALRICYSLPNYANWPLDLKNKTYDKIISILSE